MASFPFYHQLGSVDCGLACLQMIAKYYGKTIPVSLLRKKVYVGKDGVNLYGISDAAGQLGFKTSAVKLDYNTLLYDAKLPCILHWNQNHFVVLFKITRHNIHIADPAAGIIKLPSSRFLKHWVPDNKGEGIALLLEPTTDFYTNHLKGNGQQSLELRNLFAYILPHRKLFIQLIISLLIGSIVQLFIPFLAQSVVDIGIKNKDIQFIYIILFAQLALFAGRMFLDFTRSWILLYISTHINITILSDFLAKLLRLPVSFFDSKNTGDILQRMNDHQRIESFLTSSSLTVIFSIVNLFIFSIVLIIYNRTIFFVFVLLTAVYTFWIALFLKKRRSLEYKRFDLAASEQTVAIQMIQGMQEIKLNGIEENIEAGWEKVQAALFKLLLLGQKLNQWQSTGSFIINEGKNIIITFLSAKAVIDGHITLGSMLAIQYVIGQLNSPIEQMLTFVQSFQFAKISLDRINEVHSLEDEEPAGKKLLKTLPFGIHAAALVVEREKAYPNANSDSQFSSFNPAFNTKEVFIDNRTAPTIHFSNVTFTYPGAGNEPVFKNINITIPMGKTTAIVGTSGSGKTTLLKLLLKFYEPDAGDILLNDVSLTNISPKFWRSMCGVVMQDSFIFSDTIAKNIALGQETVDYQRLDYAATQANIKELIESLPQQYNTKLGSDGSGLSMGQKQRILIARAIYRNPAFILLDEATNNLDSNNENIILHNLQTFFEGRTVIVVAHRLSTVKNAAQIIVLKNGEVAEKGTHKQLVQLKGEYYTLVKNQLELEE